MSSVLTARAEAGKRHASKHVVTHVSGLYLTGWRLHYGRERPRCRSRPERIAPAHVHEQHWTRKALLPGALERYSSPERARRIGIV